MNILNKIVAAVKDREQYCFEMYERGELKPVIRSRPYDFIGKLNNGFQIIAEVKRASPSKGIIREHFDHVALAKSYYSAGAGAVSVVTEQDFFLGSKEHLKEIRSYTDLPLLRKDFIIHPAQVVESYNLGADMILLIAACLKDDDLKALLSLIRELKMTALCEIHDMDELLRVLPFSPPLLGINNRHLNDFKVDLETSFSLIKEIPSDVKVISESGIKNAADLKRLANEGFSGALIGETLLRNPDPGKALREMLAW
jgi:indole-3-glycerol phosphate synthase